MDMQADKFNDVRGDGSLGQIENISLGLVNDGDVFQGKVKYYSGSGNTPFQVVYSGVDADGNLHVFGQEFVEVFDTPGQIHEYSFTYSQP